MQRPPPPRPPAPPPKPSAPHCVKVGYDRMELHIDGRIHTLTRTQVFFLIGQMERCAAEL